MTPILAHFGHWYVELFFFVVPFVVIVGGLKVQGLRDKRRERRLPPRPRDHGEDPG